MKDLSTPSAVVEGFANFFGSVVEQFDGICFYIVSENGSGILGGVASIWRIEPDAVQLDADNWTRRQLIFFSLIEIEK